MGGHSAGSRRGASFDEFTVDGECRKIMHNVLTLALENVLQHKDVGEFVACRGPLAPDAVTDTL
jgi:hypothetical protein